ncbi:MAG: fused MFS/spermidine synthase [Thermoanaerobaculia bacterium]|nr:fused MFS/spermidine synthase [Thermoanaerobaculia bacterium]
MDIVTIDYKVLLVEAYFSGLAGFLNSVFDILGLSLRVGVSEFAGESFVYLAMFFCLCMICHGELVRRKPPSRRLTEFYLLMSTGGALGGIFVALICPQIFNFNFEIGLGFVGGYLLAVFVLSDSLRQTIWLNRTWKRRVALVGCVFLLMFVVWAQFKTYDAEAILLKRNFYGVLKVKDFKVGSADHIRELLHGRILHGSQFQDSIRRKMPTAYYVRESGIGIAFNHICKIDKPARVAVVGLGAGCLATYGRPGDYYCFYEINPDVIEIAQKHFSYLRNSPAKMHIEPGDARIRMERQQAQKYDLIALDAFTGDAIPVHLLTQEAFEVYFRHLRDPNRGIIAVHATNTYVNLLPVVQQLATHFQWQAKLVTSYFNDWGMVRSDWILLTRNTDFLTSPPIREHGLDVSGLVPENRFRLWTDQYSNLFQILK